MVTGVRACGSRLRFDVCWGLPQTFCSSVRQPSHNAMGSHTDRVRLPRAPSTECR